MTRMTSSVFLAGLVRAMGPARRAWWVAGWRSSQEEKHLRSLGRKTAGSEAAGETRRGGNQAVAPAVEAEIDAGAVVFRPRGGSGEQRWSHGPDLRLPASVGTAFRSCRGQPLT